MNKNPSTCVDTGGEIMKGEGQCAGCYLESQPKRCITEREFQEQR